MKINFKLVVWILVTLVATGVMVLAAVAVARGNIFAPVPAKVYFRDLSMPFLLVTFCVFATGDAVLDAISASGRSVGGKALASVFLSGLVWIILALTATVMGAVWLG